MDGNLEILKQYDPHIHYANCSKVGQENCTLWYDPSEGNIMNIGGGNSTGALASVRVRVDKKSLFPELMGDKDSNKNKGLQRVLDSIAKYRESI